MVVIYEALSNFSRGFIGFKIFKSLKTKIPKKQYKNNELIWISYLNLCYVNELLKIKWNESNLKSIFSYPSLLKFFLSW